jgi:hypothetical protein
VRGVEEVILRSALPLGDLDAEQAVVPLQETVEHSAVRPKQLRLREEEGPPGEIVVHLGAGPEELGVQEVRNIGALIELDRAGVLHPYIGLPASRHRDAERLEPEPAAGRGDRIDRAVGGEPLGQDDGRGGQQQREHDDERRHTAK